MAVKRIWHGWTTLDNADAYQRILLNEVIPGIEEKKIPGYLRMEVLKTEHRDEVEFVTIMTFESLQSVIDFQGADYARCYVPDAAQQVLQRWDDYSSHYELVESINYKA